MKLYNLYNRLRPKFKNGLKEQFIKFPDLVDLCTDFLISNTDVQDLTLSQWKTLLITTSDIVNRHELDYMQIFYGDTHFMTQKETEKYKQEIEDAIETSKDRKLIEDKFNVYNKNNLR